MITNAISSVMERAGIAGDPSAVSRTIETSAIGAGGTIGSTLLHNVNPVLSAIATTLTIIYMSLGVIKILKEMDKAKSK